MSVKVSEIIGNLFSKLPLSPESWTFLSIVPAAIGALLLYLGDLRAATIFFGLAILLDLVDSSVAIVKGKRTKKVKYYDAIADRYIIGFISFGLLFLNLPAVVFTASTWIFVFLFGSIMSVFAKAEAYEKGLVKEGELQVGILELNKPVIYLILLTGMAAGYFFSGEYLSYAIVFLAIATNMDAVVKIMKVRSLA